MLKESWDIFVESVGNHDKLQEDRLLEREEKKEKIRNTILSKEFFKQHDALSGDVWEGGYKLKLEIKRKLLRIAYGFARQHNIPAGAIADIYFTGSLAGYNYHPDSDIDLHIVVDFEKVNEDGDLVRDLFNSRRLVWNDRHQITILGHEVEIYVEDVDEQYDDQSRPIYSLVSGDWVRSPTKVEGDFDYDAAMKKAKVLMHQVDIVDSLYGEAKYVEAFRHSTRIFEKLKKMRKAGLVREGAYSPENIAFKILRQQGYIDHLADMKTKSYDDMLSIHR